MDNTYDEGVNAMQLFNESKGYATVANAERAARKKGIDLDNTRYIVVVVKDGRFNLAFHISDEMGATPAHHGFCVYG